MELFADTDLLRTILAPAGADPITEIGDAPSNTGTTINAKLVVIYQAAPPQPAKSRSKSS